MDFDSAANIALTRAPFAASRHSQGQTEACLQFSAAGAHAKICTLNDDERPDVPRELELVGTRGHLGKCDLHGATYYTAHGPLLRNDMILTIYLRIGRLVRIRMPHSRAFSHPGAACSHPGAACAPSQIATSWGTDQ